MNNPTQKRKPSRPIYENGKLVGYESEESATAPKATVVGDTLVGAASGADGDLEKAQAYLSKLGNAPSAVSVTLPTPHRGHVSGSPETIGNISRSLDREKEEAEATAEPIAKIQRRATQHAESYLERLAAHRTALDRAAAARGSLGGVIDSQGKITPRPLAEFRAELEDRAAIDKQAQAELSAERQARSLARANLRAMRRAISLGRVIDPGTLARAQEYLAARDKGLGGTSNVDERLEAFKARATSFWK